MLNHAACANGHTDYGARSPLLRGVKLKPDIAMKTLAEISAFGATDADNDQILFQAFEDHEAHEAVKARERFLIVGRKGSGKTAIFKRLVDTKRPDYFCFGHTFSDYPWHHHDLQARIGIRDFDKYRSEEHTSELESPCN